MKNVVVIGAGPAGLTAAYKLLLEKEKFNVVVLEEDKQVGGISKTINYHGNRMDLGGHRFFTKDEEVMNLWKDVLPFSDSYRKSFLERRRVSRIFYKGSFFDYPINLSWKTIKKLGFKDTIISGFSYLKSMIHKLPEDNLENFYINRFGRKLYEVFFRDYTEKLWGIEPSKIDSSWGSQRVKGISIKEVLKDYFKRFFKIKDNHKETSLIDKFYYPKLGPGMMYEELASKIMRLGGKINLECKVVKIIKKSNQIKEVVYEEKGKRITISCDYLISTMPIRDLISGMDKVPKKVSSVALNLPYRDFLTVGIIFDKIKIKNDTNYVTENNIIPDTWIYVQSKSVQLGRIQVFNNWSPYMVKNKNTISLGLEYFCKENDAFWKMADSDLKNLVLDELAKMGIIDSNSKVLDYHVERVKKAYPAYFDVYKDFNIVRKYLDSITNLFCIGRNGMHRYNNMDHSMKTAIVCVNNIVDNVRDKNNIWNVNTEKDYHEVNNEKNNK